MAYVYEHWRPDTNKCFYVGKGTGKRAYLFWRKDRSTHYLRVVEKLRRNGFRVEVKIIFDNLSDEEALLREQERIAFYGVDNLANQTSGGDGLRNPSIETRKKMSDASQKRFSDEQFRARHSESVRRAIARDPIAARQWATKSGAARIGKARSAETREKLSAALKGRSGLNGILNPFFGKRHSHETLKRIADKKRGTKLSEETKAKMRESQRIRRATEAINKPSPAPKPQKIPFRHTADTIEKMKIAAKKRGISEATRAANIRANTGRKRAPFKESTILKMQIAAIERERRKRENKMLALYENQLKLVA